ncbi:MAG: hypothetical protein QM804_11600 [Propionicimonas sp.]
MTSNWQPTEPAEPGPEPTPQWSQPPFASSGQPAPSGGYRTSPPDPYPVVQGAVILPASSAPPPSAAETALRASAKAIPLILIAGAIFGGLSWYLVIVGIILSSTVLDKVARDMKRRRIAQAQQQRVLPPDDQDQR